MRIPSAEWDAAFRMQTAADVRRILRWLRVDPELPGAMFAALPFVRIETDDGPALAAALLPPMEFFQWPMRAAYTHAAGPEPIMCRDMGDLPAAARSRWGCAHPESDILLVDRGTLHRQRGSALVIGEHVDATALYTNAAAFARDWARCRLDFIARLAIAECDYGLRLTEPVDGCLPGALLIGDPAKVAWPTGIEFRCPDEATAKAVQRAIYRQANFSRTVVAQPARMAA